MKNQQKLYKEMVSQGRARYQKNLIKAREQGRESNSLHARRLIQLTTQTYEEGIRAWITDVSQVKAGARHTALPYIQLLPPRLLAVLTLSTVLNVASLKNTSYPYVIMKIANSIFNEYRFTHFKKKAPILWKKLQKQLQYCKDNRKRSIVLAHTMKSSIEKNPELEVEAWPQRVRGHIGTVLLEILMESTGIVEAVTVRELGSKEEKTLVSFTAATIEWIEGFHLVVQDRFPVWSPMVEEPQDWVTPFVGGYDREYIEGGTLVKGRSEEYADKVLKGLDLSKIYESLNILQKTPWKINTNVLKVIRVIKNYGNLDLDIPGIEDKPDPAKPADIDTNPEALKRWKADVTQNHLENVVSRAKRLRIHRCVEMATKFSQSPAVYFPYQLDFRGRAYCSHSVLSPQGDDLSKALLMFARTKPVWNEEDVRWLAIHGANVFGVDKVSFTERVQWVHDNESEIIKVAEDPLTYTFWHDADKPWQFLAWCYEWYKYVEVGYGFQTALPIQIDGSNNGLQILSILARDEKGAGETNCIDHPCPVDIYGSVAKSVLKEMQSGNHEFDKYWIEFGIDRKTVKRSVMIVPYGGTIFSSEEYIRDWYREQLRKRQIVIPDLRTMNERIRYLNSKVWAAVCSHTKCAQSVMTWMMKCASIICKEGKKVLWKTPLNFPVRQDYVNEKQVTIQTAIGDKYKWTRIRVDDPTIADKRRNVNAISPNFVHSLDASILHETVRLSNKMGITDLNVVHDSFGTHCTNVNELSAALRLSAYNLFQPNLLLKLYEDLQSITDTLLPEPPELGNYEISLILDATYMFA